MKKLLTIILLSICIIGNTFAESWSGTGFALKDKYIITNHHVVDGARTLRVRGIQGDFTKTYNAVVVATDAMHDMAIIRIEDSEFPGFGEIPYTLKSGISEVGEDIFVLGYPLLSSMGDEVKLTTGVISSRSGIQGDVSAYQISAPIQPGNSGAPLFDSNGDVVGIVNSKHKQADNAGYAIKSPYISLFIQNSIGAIIPTNRNLIGINLPNKVKAIKPFVFIIYATDDGHVQIQSQKPISQNYKIGYVIMVNGVEGVVFEATEGGKHGKIVSVKQSSNVLQWSSDSYEQKRFISIHNEYNGADNMAKVKQIENWQYKYPAFAWCADLGEGWYLPATSELLAIYRNKDLIQKVISSRNGKSLSYYWSSTECEYQYPLGEVCAWIVNMGNNCPHDRRKSDCVYVRAVLAF